jgi:hypothetical protein
MVDTFPNFLPELLLSLSDRRGDTLSTMQAGPANCHIPSGSGRTRDYHHVCTSESLIFNLDTYLVWHSDPPSPLRGLRIGSQLMTNACTTLAFPTRLPIDQRTFLQL